MEIIKWQIQYSRYGRYGLVSYVRQTRGGRDNRQSGLTFFREGVNAIYFDTLASNSVKGVSRAIDDLFSLANSRILANIRRLFILSTFENGVTGTQIFKYHTHPIRGLPP